MTLLPVLHGGRRGSVIGPERNETKMNESTEKTTRDFCAEHGLTMTATYLGKGDDKPTTKDAKPWQFFRWACTITRAETRAGKLEQEYRMGLAHVTVRRGLPSSLSPNSIAGRNWVEKYGKPTPPKVEDIIDSLIMDASAIGQTFEDWASDFGYDTDSRTAEQTFRACQDAGARLLKFLGRELFDDLQNNYERL